MEKKHRKSASKWEQASERALIAIWDGKMSQLRGCRKNSHVIAEIGVEMECQGYKYSVEELKSKMHNLTTRYKKEKQKIGSSGGSPSDWDLYNEMHMLLTPYKSYNCENLVQDSINDINSSIRSPSPLPLSSPPMNISSPSSDIASPLPSSDIASPLPSSCMSMSMSSSKSKTNKKESLVNVLKKVETNLDNIQEEMQRTSRKLLQIEEEKKEILKEYVDREAEVQKALIKFLKRP